MKDDVSPVTNPRWLQRQLNQWLRADCLSEKWDVMLPHLDVLDDWLRQDFLSTALRRRRWAHVQRMLETHWTPSREGVLECLLASGEDKAWELLTQRDWTVPLGARSSTLLVLAVEASRPAWCGFLLTHGADPNIAPRWFPDFTPLLSPLHPLDVAAALGETECAKILLHHGADPRHLVFPENQCVVPFWLQEWWPDTEAVSTLDLALASGNREIAQIIHRAGGKEWAARRGVSGGCFRLG